MTIPTNSFFQEKKKGKKKLKDTQYKYGSSTHGFK